MSFNVFNCMVDNAPNLTRFKVQGDLAELRVNFSDQKYNIVMSMIDIALPNFKDESEAEKESTNNQRLETAVKSSQTPSNKVRGKSENSRGGPRSAEDRFRGHAANDRIGGGLRKNLSSGASLINIDSKTLAQGEDSGGKRHCCRRMSRTPISPGWRLTGLEDDLGEMQRGEEITVHEHSSFTQRTLRHEQPPPQITWRNWYREINLISTLASTLVPIVALYGALTTSLCRLTLAWSIVYYYFAGLGITAGYHHLWAHRSYNASTAHFLALGGSGAVEGSIHGNTAGISPSSSAWVSSSPPSSLASVGKIGEAASFMPVPPDYSLFITPPFVSTHWLTGLERLPSTTNILHVITSSQPSSPLVKATTTWQASGLKTFPDSEIRKGQYGMKLKVLQHDHEDVKWPISLNHLPILSWEDYVQMAEDKNGRDLLVSGGFIHDVSHFWALIKTRLGEDATTAFHGGIYEHSNAAHNLLAMLRVGVIEGG
ncbi:uncharacterized protein VP01_709g4 [Puccinia sorghi]|uniref:Cytochrome b5 heme-binding domain-containing protein n=1 Tax=Puccinia sorghi TaxID=27349 RepID=A0A0L6UDP2_9BASI|nr:uncharacterized protein VP01_709g4 [Puccinia sorghi]